MPRLDLQPARPVILEVYQGCITQLNTQQTNLCLESQAHSSNQQLLSRHIQAKSSSKVLHGIPWFQSVNAKDATKTIKHVLFSF